MTPAAIFIGLAIVGIALHILFFYRLRRDCRQEWARLGSPNPFLPNDIRTGWEIAKYILTGCFERLPDKKLVNLGRLLRLYECFYLVAFLTFTVFFFYSLAD
jgi:hypothetical protein